MGATTTLEASPSWARALVVACSAVWAGIACGPGTPAPPPSVVVITVDTLRADRLPSYGYDKGSTPALDSFRREAILFANAYTVCP